MYCPNLFLSADESGIAADRSAGNTYRNGIDTLLLSKTPAYPCIILIVHGWQRSSYRCENGENRDNMAHCRVVRVPIRHSLHLPGEGRHKKVISKAATGTNRRLVGRRKASINSLIFHNRDQWSRLYMKKSNQWRIF
jgi:hypothetical protein